MAQKMMTILRVPPMGKIMIEIDGVQYKSLNDLPDDKVKRLAQAAVGDLISFVGGYQLLIDEGFAPNFTPKPTRAPRQEPEELTDDQAKFLSNLETGLHRDKENAREATIRRVQSKQFLSPIKNQTFILEDGDADEKPAVHLPPPIPEIKKSTPPPPPTDTPEKPSMADHLNQILQKYVDQHPKLGAHQISMDQDPITRGLRINIDGQYYYSPKQIDNPHIQRVISMTMKEWNSRKQTNG